MIVASTSIAVGSFASYWHEVCHQYLDMVSVCNYGERIGLEISDNSCRLSHEAVTTKSLVPSPTSCFQRVHAEVQHFR